jgi:hypothetical protein
MWGGGQLCWWVAVATAAALSAVCCWHSSQHQCQASLSFAVSADADNGALHQGGGGAAEEVGGGGVWLRRRWMAASGDAALSVEIFYAPK